MSIILPWFSQELWRPTSETSAFVNAVAVNKFHCTEQPSTAGAEAGERSRLCHSGGSRQREPVH